MSVEMYLAPSRACDIVPLMCIFALIIDTAGELGLPGKSTLSPLQVRRTR